MSRPQRRYDLLPIVLLNVACGWHANTSFMRGELQADLSYSYWAAGQHRGTTTFHEKVKGHSSHHL